MASVDLATQAVPATSVHLWEVTGTPVLHNVSVIDVADPPITPVIAPCFGTGLACAAQAGTADQIETGDNRFFDAIWEDGRMWVSGATACHPDNDTEYRSCLVLLEVDTEQRTVVQDIIVGERGAYYSYPAVQTDLDGNLFVVFARSSPTDFIEARLAGRRRSDPANTMSEALLLKRGEVPFTMPVSVHPPPYPWGDFMGAARDPSDPSIVWVVGQYAKDDEAAKWGTWIASARAAAAAPTPTSTPVPSGGQRTWGDVDCGGTLFIGDAQKVARKLINLPISQAPGCPRIGDDVDVSGVQLIWADVDCMNGVTIGDAQKIARSLINLSVGQGPGCPQIGQTT